MKINILIFRRLYFFLIIISCSGDKVELGEKVTLDCVQTDPSGIVPDNLYQVGAVTITDHYPPFTKKLDVCGITLVARDEISDDFMGKVAVTISEMFQRNETVDSLRQKQLLTNLYRYRTVIPLVYGEEWNLTTGEEEAWDETASWNSLCDIIMENIPNQVMEVVEHILHHVTDVGFHYTFPEEWGLSSLSRLYEVTQEAIAQGYYDAKQYSDIDELGVRNRVILQEYAYWIIYTGWDLRKTHGPEESEWSIMTKDELMSKLPESFRLYEETILSVMASPSPETLNAFLE